MKNNISIIILWGALWGIEEATLGHLLHLTTFNIGWFLWFPLAYFFMGMVYKQSGKAESILLTSFVAAAIKLVDLFMTTKLLIVICPALSIILEGIFIFVIFKLTDTNKSFYSYKILIITTISIMWRTLYTLSILLIPAWIMPTYPYNTIYKLLKFIFVEGTMNSLFIFIVVILSAKLNELADKKISYIRVLKEKLVKSEKVITMCTKPLVSICVLAAALIIQWVL